MEDMLLRVRIDTLGVDSGFLGVSAILWKSRGACLLRHRTVRWPASACLPHCRSGEE